MSRGHSPTLAHRIEYAGFSTASALARVAGERAARRAGAALGRLAHRPFGVRREQVEANLRAAFPDRDAEWIREAAVAAYAHLGREAAALLRMSALDADAVVAGTTVAGLDRLRAAVADGGGVVAVTGHLGNWELTGATLTARGVPMDVVAQRQQNPLFDAAINRARERLGMRVIRRRAASKEALRSLRSGRVVGFVADQDAHRHGVFVPFFGRPASTHRGPALFAIRTGAPMFLVTGRRASDGGYEVEIEPVEADRGGELDAAVRRLTAAYTARLEAAVRRAPTQYFWHHRRWKTRPREEPPDATSGI